MPEPEQRLWEKLRNRQLNGLKFRRQVSIGPYIVDFYCPEIPLAVEVDGDTHGEYKQRVYDGSRQKKLELLPRRLLITVFKRILLVGA